MNFKTTKRILILKNIDIDRKSNFERITVGVIIFMCPVLVFGDYKNATFYQD